jgi:hypothetical protein
VGKGGIRSLLRPEMVSIRYAPTEVRLTIRNSLSDPSIHAIIMRRTDSR